MTGHTNNKHLSMMIPIKESHNKQTIAHDGTLRGFLQQLRDDLRVWIMNTVHAAPEHQHDSHLRNVPHTRRMICCLSRLGINTNK